MFYGTPVLFNKNTCLEEISGGGGIVIERAEV
jgi:predicted outer membrane repeat protein